MKIINIIIKTIFIIVLTTIISNFLYMNLYRRNNKMDYNIEMTYSNIHGFSDDLDEFKEAKGKYPIDQQKGNRYYFEHHAYHESYNSGKINKNTEFQYLSNGAWFLIWGAGPDEKFEQNIISWTAANKDNLTSFSFANMINPILYDPTNGLISRGDMFYSSDILGQDARYLFEKDRMKIYY